MYYKPFGYTYTNINSINYHRHIYLQSITLLLHNKQIYIRVFFYINNIILYNRITELQNIHNFITRIFYSL